MKPKRAALCYSVYPGYIVEKAAEKTGIPPRTAMSHEGMQVTIWQTQKNLVLLIIATIIIFLKCAITSPVEPCVRHW